MYTAELDIETQEYTVQAMFQGVQHTATLTVNSPVFQVQLTSNPQPDPNINTRLDSIEKNFVKTLNTNW